MIVREHTTTWLGYLLKMRRGSVSSQIKWRLLFFFLVAMGVTVSADAIREARLLLSPLPLSVVGVALSIFLGFRNSAAYDRFWEGRKLWGALVNTSRTFAREVISFPDVASWPEAQRADVVALQHRLVRTCIAFVRGLKLHLRDDPSWQQLGLDDERSEQLQREHNRPTAVVAMMADDLAALRRSGAVDSFHHAMLARRLGEFTDIQGGCERIKSTPIPLSHTALTHRICALYLLALPLALLEGAGVLTPFVTLFVAFAFLGLDAIGDEMEDPFGIDLNDLPLDTIATNIEINLRQRLGDPRDVIPTPPTPDRDGVLL
ncbi:MAG: bestrophin family protein [Myxococcota bacterium]